MAERSEKPQFDPRTARTSRHDTRKAAPHAHATRVPRPPRTARTPHAALYRAPRPRVEPQRPTTPSATPRPARRDATRTRPAHGTRQSPRRRGADPERE